MLFLLLQFDFSNFWGKKIAAYLFIRDVQHFWGADPIDFLGFK
jgi:hypothetical protein